LLPFNDKKEEKEIIKKVRTVNTFKNVCALFISPETQAKIEKFMISFINYL